MNRRGLADRYIAAHGPRKAGAAASEQTELAGKFQSAECAGGKPPGRFNHSRRDLLCHPPRAQVSFGFRTWSGPLMPVREMLALIPVFDAILTEGSISRAAERLGVTQSAVSQSLARLRKLTGDELFETTGRGVRPTPRALVMAKHLQTALAEVNEAMASKEIEIATLNRTFVVDIGAGFDSLILPVLYPVLAKEAPGVKLLISNTRGADLINELKFGQTELAYDFQAGNAEGIRSELVGSGPAAVIARKDHPSLKSGISKELYLALPHAALVWNRSSTASGVALELERLGLEPRVQVSVPTLITMGAVVAASDLIATTSVQIGGELALRYDLRVHRMPIPLPHLTLYQLWHARYDSDAGHQWLRERIRTLHQQYKSP